VLQTSQHQVGIITTPMIFNTLYRQASQRPLKIFVNSIQWKYVKFITISEIHPTLIIIRKNVLFSPIFFLLMAYSFHTGSSAYHLRFYTKPSQYRGDRYRKLGLEQAVTRPEVKITDKSFTLQRLNDYIESSSLPGCNFVSLGV